MRFEHWSALIFLCRRRYCVNTLSQKANERPLLLLADHRPEVSSSLREVFDYEGFEVLVANEGVSAITVIEQARPDVVILNLHLPSVDGYAVIKRLRESRNLVPVIAVSPVANEVACVAALRCGADDFMGWPLNLLELTERTWVQVRRNGTSVTSTSADTQIWIGETCIDVPARLATRHLLESKLRPKELDLLMFLWNSAGAVVTKEKLLSLVWGHKQQIKTRTLDFHVALLRTKIELDTARPRHLLTVRSTGYRLIR